MVLSSCRTGTLPDVPAVVNFGPGETKEAFAALAKFRPGQPLMAGEYWAGWFDHWGGKHAATDTAEQVRDLKWMLAQGYSVNLYMFHGGTTFGFMNGANFGTGYEPDTTSYDYDAALDESGHPTKKYFEFREVIAAANPAVKLPDVPSVAPMIGVEPFVLSESSSLWNNLPLRYRLGRQCPWKCSDSPTDTSFTEQRWLARSMANCAWMVCTTTRRYSSTAKSRERSTGD